MAITSVVYLSRSGSPAPFPRKELPQNHPPVNRPPSGNDLDNGNLAQQIECRDPSYAMN
jgi:hypothetical protein